jgi:hypothetical protein
MTAFVVYRYTNIFRKWALSFLFSPIHEHGREMGLNLPNTPCYLAGDAEIQLKPPMCVPTHQYVGLGSRHFAPRSRQSNPHDWRMSAADTDAQCCGFSMVTGHFLCTHDPSPGEPSDRKTCSAAVEQHDPFSVLRVFA